MAANVWFAGQLIGENGAPVYGDRLGTNRGSGARFYPFGDEITSTSNDRTKFGTYLRDSFTGLDYADQRMYASGYGRFNTPDPYQASAKGANNPRAPISWNRYSYVLGDPVNHLDRHGLYLSDPCDSETDPGCSDGCSYEGEYCYGDGGGGDGGDGGGSGGSEAPNCNPGGDAATQNRIDFVTANYGAASNIAANYGVDKGGLTLAFLSWSAEESGYGLNAQNIAENNWFGAQDKPNQAGWWSGTSVVCNRNGSPIPVNSTNACFGVGLSWGQELWAILNTKSGKTGQTYETAIETVLDADPAASAVAILTGIQQSGWNRRSTYASKAVNDTALAPVIDCLMTIGAIH